MTGSGRSGRNARGQSTAPPIEKVPFLGTTWYTRGAAYWFRRALASFLMLMCLAGATAITVGLVAAVVESDVSAVLKVIVLVVVAAAILLSIVRASQAFFRVERDRKRGNIFRPDFNAERASSKAQGQAGAGVILAAGARAGSVVASALLVVSVIFSFGWFIVMFIWTLQRELGVEHDARLRLEQRQASSRGERQSR